MASGQQSRHGRWRVFAAGLLGLVVLALAAVHTPMARRAVLARLIAALEASGVRLEATELSYNLLRLTATLDNATLTADAAQTPFLRADALRIDLPWSAVWGPLSVQALEVEHPRVAIVREESGATNLPALAGSDTAGSEPIEPIAIGRLLIHDLDVRYADALADAAVTASGLTLDVRSEAASQSAGTLTMARPATVRLGDQETVISSLDGRLAFDGRTLAVTAFDLTAPEVRVHVDGRVDVLAENPRLALKYDITAEAEELAPWLGLSDPAPTGTIAAAGVVDGPLEAPVVRTDFTTNRLVWPDLGDVSLSSRVAVTASTADVESLRVAVAGGEITGDAHLGLDEAQASVARLAWHGLDVHTLAQAAPALPVRLASFASGEGSVEWTGAEMRRARGRIAVRLQAPGSAPAALPALPIDGRVDLQLEDGRWTAALDETVAGVGRLAGTASGRLAEEWAASTLGGNVRLEVGSFTEALTRLSAAGLDVMEVEAASGIRGAAMLQADLGGTFGAPRMRGTLELNDAWFDETGPAEGTVAFGVTARALDVEALNLSVGSNTVSGQGSIEWASGALRGQVSGELTQLEPLLAPFAADWRADGAARINATLGGTLAAPAVEARVAASGVDLTNAAIPLHARVDLQLRTAGALDSPQASGTIGLADLAYGDYQLGRATAEVGFADGTATVRASLPAANATIEGSLALEDQTFAASASIAAVDLSALARPAGPAGPAGPGAAGDGSLVPVDVTGTATLRASVAGDLDDPSAATADVDLRLTDTAVSGVPIDVDQPIRLRYADREVIADNLELGIGSSRLSARGRLGAGAAAAGGLRLDFVGSLADFVPLARVASPSAGVQAAGAVELHVRAAGSLEAPDISGTLALTEASVGANEIPAATGLSLRATYADGMLDLERARGEWQGAELAASGRLPVAVLGDAVPAAYRRSLPQATEPARAEIRLTSVTPLALEPFVARETLAQIGGRIDVSATVEAAGLDPSQITADVTFDRAALELAQVPLEQTEPTRLRLAGGRLEVVQWDWSGAGNRLAVAGGVRWAEPSPLLDVGVTGSLDLRMIGAFATDVAASGRVSLDVRATGPASEPEVAGDVSVDGADLVVRSPRLAITDLRGAAALTADTITLRELSADANGGTISAQGTLRYEDFALTGGTLAIRGRGLALEVPEDLRTEVDADLTLTTGETGPALTGRVTILRGAYREPVSLTEQLLAGNASVVAAPLDEEPGPFDAVQLNVSVVSAEDVVVDNNYARVEAGGDLRVVGTIGEPAMAGRLTVREGGEVFLGGRTYEVRRGTVDFTSPTRIEPNVDLALETRVQDYDITLEITGTPETLEVSLRSPGQSQEDVVSLLLTGQLADETTAAQSEIARGQLLMLLSGEFLGFAGRAVGLDSVQVSRGLGGAGSDFDLLATNTDPSARLTVSKRLSSDVEIIFSQSLRESGDITWIAIYRPGYDVELRATTRDDATRGYEFRHQVTFGRSPGAGDESVPASAAERSDVASVAFTGTPGVAEATLRDLVDLEAGDRFDFYRWQRDRDRLIAWYHDHDFLEAHIAARRRPVDAAGATRQVALEYEIDSGPVTSLVIEGASLPGDLVDRMREAWGEAVFDGFLFEDLQRLARERLIRDGYLQAAATAEVAAGLPPGEKRIVLRIEPGRRYDERRIAFSGNARIPSAALQAAIQAAGVGAEAWMTPRSVALQSALERFYRSRGYLAAAVTPQPPVFAGATATLPVQIEEGALFVVGDVAIDGADAIPPEEVRATVDLAPGTPFLASVLEPARRRLEAEYLRRAFNDARVSAAAEVDRVEGRVDVHLTVVEGRQQVVSSVDVRGDDVTRPGVIDRALDLDPGDPADLSQIYRAQKRLYDTGVFQNADVSLAPVEGAGETTPGVQPVQAVVTLQEMPRYRFRYGFRLNDEVAPAEATRQVRPALIADLLRRNVFGRAWSTGVAGQLEKDRRLARAYLSIPTLFGRQMVTNLFVTTSREFFPPETEFDLTLVERVNQFTLEQRFRPATHMAVTYGYSFAFKHNFEPNHDPDSFLPPHDVSTRIGRLTSTYAWDTRDDPSNAHRGWFHSSGLEFGSQALGSNLRFIKYLAQQYYFRSVDGGVVLASAFRLGMGRGFGGQDLDEKFFAGGGTTVRGFAEEGLGKSDFFGPLGGNALLLLNQEVRFPIYKWVRGVGFFDAGNVYTTASDLSFTDLEAGTGVGLRIDSPFVLVRVDFGIPLTRRDEEPSGRWYFAIGHTF